MPPRHQRRYPEMFQTVTSSWDIPLDPLPATSTNQPNLPAANPSYSPSASKLTTSSIYHSCYTNPPSTHSHISSTSNPTASIYHSCYSNPPSDLSISSESIESIQLSQFLNASQSISSVHYSSNLPSPPPSPEPHFPPYPSPPPSAKSSTHLLPYTTADLASDPLQDMPSGYPYNSVLEIGCFCLEFLGGMQALVMGWMEVKGEPRRTT